MSLPPQVQSLVDAAMSLPGVVACYCSPTLLEDVKLDHLSLPGEFGDLPQAIIRRTNGGRSSEVMLQVELVLDRTQGAWLTLEFLAWLVRDWGRSGYDIQMRPMALPPKAHHIQLGDTLKFLIEYFIFEDESGTKVLEAAGELGEAIAESHEQYRECFDDPAEFTGVDEE